MAAPDLFGILDAVKKLTAPAGMEAVHLDGMSWARNGLTYGDSTKLTADDWNRIIGNLRGLLVGSGADLNTLDPASPMLLRDVLVNYIIGELADVLPDYIESNAGAIAADIVDDPGFTAVVGATLGALTFKFATATADADPGTGLFRLNNASPAAATTAYIDNADAFGTAATAILDTWDDSTNAIRGTLIVRPVATPASQYTYNVTGSVVDGTGYRKLTLAYVAGSGAIASGATCWLVFTRAGDKGDFSGPASAISDNVVTFNGTTGKVAKDSGVAVSSLAPKASPTFSGTPAAPTAAPGTNTTQIATTGFVKAAIDVVLGGVSTAFDTLSELATALGLLAPIASPTFTGTPAAPTAAPGTNSTQLATTAFVASSINYSTGNAALLAGGVGTYSLCATSPAASLGTGQVVAGSTLKYSHAGGNPSGTTSPPGSWQCMSATSSTGGAAGVAVFLRVS
ncbi:hypothetical protein [Mesorhizobium sp.]|uniref:hypothetical protein n=1 Tax=Mesorhizobium sp. TaxID=1871066 RepID=UPI001210383C|nr:hypothetical protein [Mesorhizobium sp.]TJV19700.1 MAG: hypothetical protein E5Y07_00470 [Mesorhizobium sp.]